VFAAFFGFVPLNPFCVIGRSFWLSPDRRGTGSAGEVYLVAQLLLDEAGAADWMNWREPDPLSLNRLLVPAPEDLLVVRPASPLFHSLATTVS